MKYFLLGVSALIILFLTSKFAQGQITGTGTAITYPLTDAEAQASDIICSYPTGNVRCNKAYDPAMLGVVTASPSAEISDTEMANPRLITSIGVVVVRVFAVNGPIKAGDFLTSSETAGVGQLGKRNGYVLGNALDDYNPTNPTDIGTVTVALNIHPAAGLAAPGSNLLQFVREGLVVPLLEPLESLRYLLAVAMVLISFTLGMIYFGRVARTGVEAIGRNPLAQRVIQFTIVFNIVLTIVIVLVGLGIAYLILIL